MDTTPAPIDGTRLAELMARIAAGDRAAGFSVLTEFGDRLRSCAGYHLSKLGVRGPDLVWMVEDLVLDIVIEALPELARWWRPDGGAVPWSGYGRHRVRNLASRLVGQHADEFDPERHDDVAVPAGAVHAQGEIDLDVLERCAAHDALAGLFRRALHTAIARQRDRDLWLTYRVQLHEGDPSPAHTVGALLDMQAPAVRQAYRRANARLVRLVGSDPEFGALGDAGFAA